MAASKHKTHQPESKPQQRAERAAKVAAHDGRARVNDPAEDKAGARTLGRALDDHHQAPESGEKPAVMPASPSASAGAKTSGSAGEPARAEPPKDVAEIYRALKRNAGREWVTDENVAALIELAHREQNAQLEYLLREWRSTCGEDAAAPPLDQVQGVPPR